MSRETVKYLVDMIPEDETTKDEVEAIAEAKADTSPTVSHESIDWG